MKIITGKTFLLWVILCCSLQGMVINDVDAFTTRIFPNDKHGTIVRLFSDDPDTEAEADGWVLRAADMTTNF